MSITEEKRSPAGAAPGAGSPQAGEGERLWMKRLPWISGPVMLVLLVAVWQFTVSVVGVSEYILPAPLAVLGALGELMTGPDIWGHIGITLL
ncbi:hypothetical protein I4I78_29745, partial [Pseudonocardia sp. KRD-291]|nr:hypothetical protein [Pseudonocardia sp. KRD291]